MTTPLQRETMDRTITVINCNDWRWKWVFRGLWRGWGPRRPNLEGRHAACEPPPAWVIVPMCSVPGCIPWGTAHTGGHLKAYLDVAAIRVRTSTQGSNLFQLLECAGGTEMRPCMCVCVGRRWGVGGREVMVCQMAKTCLPPVHTHTHIIFSYSSTHLRHNP